MASDQPGKTGEKNFPTDGNSTSPDPIRKPAPSTRSWVTPLPTGTVTFLFSDIEGSTPLWERDSASMAACLEIHNDILQQAIANHGGIVFKIIGDEFNAAFHTASLALKAAIQAQRNLLQADWKGLEPLRVRMGIHTGEAFLDVQGEYAVSLTTTRAARVMTAGNGGQILLSQESADLCVRSLPQDVELVDLGLHRLKGLANPERLFQASVTGLGNEFPSLRTLDRCPNNLPLQLTSFVGREQELAEVHRLLRQSRLLTLTGVGGTGKTRLALQATAEALEEFEHGAWLVELAPLSDPALVLATVAAVFGYYGDRPEMPLQTRLLHHLHDKTLLLLLDNCEHLVSTTAQLVDTLLHAAPELKVLATSREALGLSGETAYPVPSLSMPDPAELPSLETLTGSDAVQLFVERARAARPSFTLAQANAIEVAHICRRLDGIPLALELAAARLKAFSTQQICERLDNRFRLLTGGSRTALPRQQTLRATIDWSYGLLSELERALLRRLSVFAGGWSLAAAESVCATPDQDEDVFDLLANLVNKSLVEAEQVAGDLQRYRMLETVRQYAQEKLDETGESARMRDRHLAYYLELARSYESNFRYNCMIEAFKPFSIEVDNIRLALGWAFGGNDQEMILKGLGLVNSLFFFWLVDNFCLEGITWANKGLELLTANDEKCLAIRAETLCSASQLYLVVDNNRAGSLCARESVNIYRSIEPDPYRMAAAVKNLANTFGLLEPSHPSAVSEAERKSLLEESNELFQLAKVPQGMMNALFTKTNFAIADSRFEDALRLVEELQVSYPGGGFAGVMQQFFLAQIARKQGNDSQWLENQKIALEKLHKVDYHGGIAYTTLWIGYYYLDRNEYDLAQAYYLECLDVSKKNGFKGVISLALSNLVDIALVKKHYSQVGEWLQLGLTLAPEIELERALRILLALFISAREIARPALLARWLGFIQNKAGGASREFDFTEEHDRYKNELLSRMDEVEFQASYEAGHSLSIEQVLLEARPVVNELANMKLEAK
jgi:predicted ATPase/class 3 adenylate cyclase